MDTMHDKLAGEVAGVFAEPDLLVCVARRRGLAQRRQRRALVTVGAAAAATVVALASWPLLPDHPQPPTTAQTTTSSPAPRGADASPRQGLRLTGRATAAVLLSLLPTRGNITVERDSVRGSGGVPLADDRGDVVVTAAENDETYAEAAVSSTAGRSLLTVNVQGADFAVAWPKTGCPDWANGCRRVELGSGDLLRTYSDDSDKPGSVRVVAEVIRPSRDLRIAVATATPSGESPAILGEELSRIATSAVWGRRVSDDLSGAALDFESLDAGSTLHPVDP